MNTQTDDALEGLARRLGVALESRGLLLATAESCTGGWVSMALTAVPGSSRWFDRGFVTYSNAAKQEMLGVPAATLETHGAVSEATAQAMVHGAIEHSDASVALAITGIAGPGGGTVDKPVGTVCFAWSVDGDCSSSTCQFDGDRAAIRRQAVARVISGVLERLHD